MKLIMSTNLALWRCFLLMLLSALLVTSVQGGRTRGADRGLQKTTSNAVKEKEDKEKDAAPTSVPTPSPTASPTVSPTAFPTMSPTKKSKNKDKEEEEEEEEEEDPPEAEAREEKVEKTKSPTSTPTIRPTAAPTNRPTVSPTAVPSVAPTPKPTVIKPTVVGTGVGSIGGVGRPIAPISFPTPQPVAPDQPTQIPTTDAPSILQRFSVVQTGRVLWIPLKSFDIQVNRATRTTETVDVELALEQYLKNWIFLPGGEVVNVTLTEYTSAFNSPGTQIWIRYQGKMFYQFASSNVDNVEENEAVMDAGDIWAQQVSLLSDLQALQRNMPVEITVDRLVFLEGQADVTAATDSGGSSLDSGTKAIVAIAAILLVICCTAGVLLVCCCTRFTLFDEGQSLLSPPNHRERQVVNQVLKLHPTKTPQTSNATDRFGSEIVFDSSKMNLGCDTSTITDAEALFRPSPASIQADDRTADPPLFSSAPGTPETLMIVEGNEESERDEELHKEAESEVAVVLDDDDDDDDEVQEVTMSVGSTAGVASATSGRNTPDKSTSQPEEASTVIVAATVAEEPVVAATPAVAALAVPPLYKDEVSLGGTTTVTQGSQVVSEIVENEVFSSTGSTSQADAVAAALVVDEHIDDDETVSEAWEPISSTAVADSARLEKASTKFVPDLKPGNLIVRRPKDDDDSPAIPGESSRSRPDPEKLKAGNVVFRRPTD